MLIFFKYCKYFFCLDFHLKHFFFFCSSVVEDCEEAFVRNLDGHSLVLYLRTEEGSSLTDPIRELLEKVNTADKAAKVKVCLVNLKIKENMVGVLLQFFVSR